MRRILTALALSATLALGACQNPDGSTNWGQTLALGAGVGLGAALLAGAASDNDRPRHYRSGGYGGRSYAYDRGGYGRGYYR
jgi:hypothetical protein